MSRKLWILLAMGFLVGEVADSVSHAQPLAPADSPLLVEPTTPDELFDAVELMTKLNRPNLARQYLDKFLATNPTEDYLLGLYDKKGPGLFLRLEKVRELQPVAGQLLDRINAGFRKRNNDPQRINTLIDDLNGTAQEREVALITLRSAGPIVVPHMIRRLANPRTPAERDRIAFAMIRLGSQNVPALLGAMNAPDDRLRASVVDILGYLGTKDTVQYLWYPAFAQNQPSAVQTSARRAIARIYNAAPERVDLVSSFGVAKELREITLNYFQNGHEWETDPVTGLVPIWTWAPQLETIEKVMLEPEAASIYRGSQFARQSLAMAPDHAEAQSIYLGMALAQAKYEAGWTRPIPTGPGTAHDLALTAGADVLQDSLVLSLKYHNTQAAIAILNTLGQISTRHQLAKKAIGEAPLLLALNYPDQRVQFTAASTILQMDPEKPFSGANRIIEILSRALNSEYTGRALVVHPNSERAATMAGFMGEMGYEPQSTTTGRDAFRVAASRSDIEIIVLNANIVQWALSDTMKNLRADSRTAGIPIMIYGPPEVKSNVLPLVNQYPATTFVTETFDSTLFQAQVNPFLSRLKSPPLTPEQRSEQAASAAYWFAHIGNGQRTNVFDLRGAETVLFDALNDDQLAANALIALGAIPTNDTQNRLQEIATSPGRNAQVRELAAVQLAFHIQKYGLVLSNSRVDEVKTAWEQAPTPDLSTALASVIGSLKPNSRLVGERLQQFAPPTLPQPPQP